MPSEASSPDRPPAPAAPRILFAGGGTGGHIYPAIAIADAVRALEPGAVIEFAGTRDRMEWTAVPKAGYAIHPITVSGLHRKLTLRNLAFPFRLLKGLAQSWSLVGAFDPDVVVGTGGYVSGPVLWAAGMRKRPILVQEQNAYAGLTNRLLARLATRVHIAFEEARRYFDDEKCVLSGNPTRPELQLTERAEGRAALGLADDARVLFVFGGSLGSAALNAAMQARAPVLLADEGLHVLWQTGRLYYDRLEAQVEPHPRLRMMQYVDRMDQAYAAADLVLSRAGAITCSELMVTGTPAVLVPSPNVAEDHQTKNARAMADEGAAVVLPEAELGDGLVETVRGLLDDPERRAAMSRAARSMARPDAAEDIARDVLRIAGWRRVERPGRLSSLFLTYPPLA